MNDGKHRNDDKIKLNDNYHLYFDNEQNMENDNNGKKK